jgi:curved DNA-binding protein CbpA
VKADHPGTGILVQPGKDLSQSLIPMNAMLTEKRNSLKDYYYILGLEKGASLEEITARWLEFKKQFQFTPEKHNGTDKRMKEINEAYRILKASVPPADEFDLGEYRKKVVLARKAKRRAAEKKKTIILFSGILAICVISGASFFILTRSPGTDQLPSATQADANRITRGFIEEPAASAPLESKSPVMITKTAPQEPSKTASSESSFPVPISKEPPTASVIEDRGTKVKEELPKPPALKPAPPVKAAKVVPQEPSKTAVPGAVSPPLPKPPALKPAPPVEAAKVVPQEPSKATIPESFKPVSEEPPAVSIPPPIPRVLKPGPLAEEAQVVPQEQSKINIPEGAKIASLPSPPSALASEREVLQFFQSYVNRYNSKSIDGFISFFSSKAIQNQKDTFEKIRKIYGNFFDRMETVQYRIAINKIEPRQNNVEVRGQYQLEGVVAKGEKKQNWKGQIRWVLVRENGALKILSLDYEPQK